MNFALFVFIGVVVAVVGYLTLKAIAWTPQKPAPPPFPLDFLPGFIAATHLVIKVRDWDASNFSELRRDLIELEKSPILQDLQATDEQFAKDVRRALSQGYTSTVFQLPEDFTLTNWDALSAALESDDEATFFNLILSAPCSTST